MNERIHSVLRANCATATCVKIEDVPLFQEFLEERDYHVCLVELSPQMDELETFFQIISALPMGGVYKRLHSDINLASFDDIMGNIVSKYPKIALIIANSELLLENYANLFFDIFSIFTIKSHAMRSAIVTTFLVGEGPNFVDKLSAKPEKSVIDSMKYAAKPRELLTPEEQIERREHRKQRKTENLEKMKAEQSEREAKMTEEQIVHFRKVIHSMEQSLLNWDKTKDTDSSD